MQSPTAISYVRTMARFSSGLCTFRIYLVRCLVIYGLCHLKSFEITSGSFKCLALPLYVIEPLSLTRAVSTCCGFPHPILCGSYTLTGGGNLCPFVSLCWRCCHWTMQFRSRGRKKQNRQTISSDDSNGLSRSYNRDKPESMLKKKTSQEASRFGW